MPVTGINHVNIRTTDIAASVRFFVNIFGFVHAERPPARGEVGNWLHDAEGNPIIHLRMKEPEAVSTGPIDHVALNCRDKAGIIARLRAYDVPYTAGENIVADGVTQVFVKDPSGVLLELAFESE